MDFVDAMSEDGSVLECETLPGSPDDHEGGCEPPGDDGVDDMVVDAAMDGGDDEAVVEAGAIDGADGHIPLHGADHALDVPGGTLRLYKHANVIRAFCKCSTHKKCVVERTCTPNDARPSQGRPLGLLVSWLALQHHPAVICKKSHVWHRPLPDLKTRQEARRSVRHLVGIRPFLNAERKESAAVDVEMENP